ncbi:peptide synthase [candidate division KSB3 bacterium]|uniref:Peptide synthase n=1 Tax=candidate division KSB3 bacterium TaxID=2044937 RepID=A0A2G6E3I7_9BACT|nr:MAG: peptide synthase [candidate division KSB3 bacterium]PIE28929.1 MAG: peptide synthase [candidate division KSB3 bacterium]
MKTDLAPHHNSSRMTRFNIAQALEERAKHAPFQPAVIFPAGRDKQGRAKFTQLSFQQLNELCDSYAYGLAGYGLTQGTRTLIMVKPGIDLIAVTFALLKIGAVPVLIDPGMGHKAFLQCVTETEPRAMIGIPLAHIIRTIFPRAFRTITHFITAGRRLFWSGKTLDALRIRGKSPFPAAPTTLEDEAAVAFTSGGTGIPKGVVYLHGIFKKQLEIMQNDMGIEEGEVHLAVMYIFALFNPALGVTSVIPDMDPRRTAELNPAYLVEAIQTHGVTMSLGSPLIWEILGNYCLKQNISLPSLKHIFMFGAAVMPDVIEKFAKVMPQGRIYTPYGATEALPLTMLDAEDILQDTGPKTYQGAGVCVGKPIGGLQVRIIPISDEAIHHWDESLCLAVGEIGEIVVKGGVVTHRYLNRPQHSAEAKICDHNGVWHRMGDLGYIDQQGRIWICGRKAHRVSTPQGLMLPIQCEAIFNRHQDVKRSALIGIGKYGQQRPLIIIESMPGTQPRSRAVKKAFADSLLILGKQYEASRSIQTILFHSAFPVDVRHNTKIDRLALAEWAARELKKESALTKLVL